MTNISFHITKIQPYNNVNRIKMEPPNWDLRCQTDIQNDIAVKFIIPLFRRRQGIKCTYHVASNSLASFNENLGSHE